MLKIYIKIAWRNLKKDKVSSVINIGGLAIGMAVALLIGMWVYDELSFNKYFKNYDRIAQVMTRGRSENGPYASASLQYPLSITLQADYKNHFKHLVTASGNQDVILATGNKKISGTGQYMGEGAPEMLSLKMKYGNSNGLKDPYSIMLSTSLAKALFGNVNPINNTVTINNKIAVKTTGVYEDMPLNTEFHAIHFFAPFQLYVLQNEWVQKSIDDWDNHFLKMYAEIKPNTDFNKASYAIKDAELKHLDKSMDYASYKPQVFLQPMSKWHLYPFNDIGSSVLSTPLNMVWLVGATGMFVLLLACINFMNLSTARSQKRAKEVGVRKAIGSARRQLIYQFFSESYLVVLHAFCLALLVVALCLPWFNGLAAKQMELPWSKAGFWFMSAGFIFITGLLSGSYPAFYLSSFNPVNVLKGTFRVGRLAAIPRKALVVLQFTVSVTLIISTIIVYRQIQLGKNRPIGYSREGLIIVDMKSDDFYGRYEVLRSELKNTGVVTEMAQSMGKVPKELIF